MLLLRRVSNATLSKRRDLAALAFLAVCCLVLFNNAVLRGWIYYEFDTTIYYYPMTAWVDRALEQGRVALWSPYIYGGFPVFADGESGALYPLNLIALTLLSPAQAFVWLTVLRYFLAAAFGYGLLRVLRLSPIPALVGSLTMTLGSFLITQMHHVNVVSSAMWLPLILLCAELVFRGVGWRRILFVALGGVAVGMQLLTIHIQPVLMTALALVLYLVFRAFFGRELDLPARLKRALVAALGIGLTGLGLGAVQLLPLLELAAQAVRGGGGGYDFATAFGPSPFNLVTLLFPYFFRIAGYDYWTLWFRWETTIYVGIAPLLLAVVAVALRRSRETFFFTGLGLLGLLLALGEYAPFNLYWLVWHIPGFSLARAPGRFSLLFVFSVGVLAAFGLQYLQAHLQRRTARSGAIGKLLIATAVATGVLFVGLVAARSWLLAHKSDATSWIAANYLSLHRQDNVRLNPDQIYDALLGTLRWQNGRTALTFGLLVAAVAVMAIWYYRPRFATACQGVVAALVAIDLLAFAMIFHPEMPLKQLEEASGSAKFLALHRGLHRVFTIQPVGPTIPNRMLPLRVATVGGYSSLDWSRYRDLLRRVREGNVALLDLWNVRYVVAPRNSPAPGGRDKFRPVYEDRDNVVYENSSYLPRAFVANAAHVADSRESALAAVTAAQFDARRHVVVEAEPGDRQKLAALVARATSSTGDAPAGRATIADYDSTVVTINAEASEDDFLVLSDSYYPGWNATVDGRAATIYRADYLFRAIFLPKGSHVVTLRYEPMSFRLGAAISVAVALLLPFGVYLAAMAQRRQALRHTRQREPVLDLGGMA